MTYTEPPQVFKGPFEIQNGKSKIGVKSSENLLLEIEFLDNFGWVLELRYDQSVENFKRQIFTGVQESIKRQNLEQTSEAGGVSIKSGDQEFRLTTDGSIEIHINQNLIFNSPFPFSFHPVEKPIYENLMSLKVTDLAERAPFSWPGKTFLSNMVRFQYPRPDSVILGLPGQTGELNRNGYRFELYNTDEFIHTPLRKPLYQSWPILIHKAASGTGWLAVYHDNPSRTFVDIGDFYEDRVTFESLSGNTRVYVAHGATLQEVSHKMAHLHGGSYFPPLWAFGYQQCRWSYMNSGEIRKIIQRLRESDLPCDAIYFDIDYMDGFRVFTSDKERFPDLEKLILELKQEGVKSVCIIDPGVKIDSDYQVYQRLSESDAYLKLENDEPLVAKVWPGETILPDFADERASNLWKEFQADWLTKYAFDGIWNDMNEPSNFDGGNANTEKSFTSRGPFRNEYNLYGYHMAAVSHAGWEKAFPNKRGLIITRSGYPGVQKNAIIWHGDNMAWWEHLRLAIDTCIQYSLSGAYYTGPDVPGFTQNPPEDLAIRFFQLGSFLPLFRGHSIYFAKDKEPFAFGERATSIIRDAIKLRYSLLREWYSGFERSIRENLPSIMPVMQKSGIPVRDQFILFEKFLVAPVIERDQTKKLVYLPEGGWYRLGENSKLISGDTWLSLDISLKDLPVFVRAGSVVVRNIPGKNVDDTFANKEQFTVYADSSGRAEGYWFCDDGESKDFSGAIRKRLISDGSTGKVFAEIIARS